MYMNFFSMLISIEIWMLLLLIALMFDKNVFVRMLFQILLHWKYWLWWLSVHFSSVAQLCPTLCHSMNCSTPGLPVHHQLLELTQTHVHRVSDAIQPSHPLSSPSPPAPQSLQASESFPMSQLVTWGSQSTEVSALASFLAKNTQGRSPLEWTGWISLQSKGLSIHGDN